MLAAARGHGDRGGNISTSAGCLLALAGIEHPTPEQTAGAHLLALGLSDLHVLALGKNLKE